MICRRQTLSTDISGKTAQKNVDRNLQNLAYDFYGVILWKLFTCLQLCIHRVDPLEMWINKVSTQTTGRVKKGSICLSRHRRMRQPIQTLSEDDRKHGVAPEMTNPCSYDPVTQNGLRLSWRQSGPIDTFHSNWSSGSLQSLCHDVPEAVFSEKGPTRLLYHSERRTFDDFDEIWRQYLTLP